MARADNSKGANVEKLLLTIPEASAALGVSRTTMYELLGARLGLEVVHIGRSARVTASSLRRYVETLAEVQA